jgi:hypothetical protein
MGQILRLAVAVMVLAVCVATVRAQDNIAIFGGYSYLRPSITAEVDVPTSTTTSNQNLNGWELSGTYKLLPFFGLTADFSGHYGSAVNNGGTAGASQEFFMAGPQVSLPSHISPFAHVLVGGTHQSIGSGLYGGFPVLPTSSTGFALAVGGGIDVKLIPHIWVRAIQVDYMSTHLNGGTQSEPRISAGVVIHL